MVMTPAPISVERLRELLDALDIVSAGDYLSRLANGQRINDACINWLRENGAALLQQLAERDAEINRIQNAWCVQVAELHERLDAAERAREDAYRMLREIHDSLQLNEKANATIAGR